MLALCSGQMACLYKCTMLRKMAWNQKQVGGQWKARSCHDSPSWQLKIWMKNNYFLCLVWFLRCPTAPACACTQHLQHKKKCKFPNHTFVRKKAVSCALDHFLTAECPLHTLWPEYYSSACYRSVKW